MTALSRPLVEVIAEQTGRALDVDSATAVSGGSINSCYRINDRARRAMFLKLNEPDCADMFAAELEGLRELRAAKAVRVPEPVACGVAEEAAWLLMEGVDLVPGSAAAGARLGAQLAAQHRHTAGKFGWWRDNSIGTTLQRNVQQSDWVTFMRSYRLGFQLRLATENGGGPELQDKGGRLLEELPRFFVDHVPMPSLLHGDLWGGNWAMTRGDEPVIFDPAVYYGDREADIAMTKLFGGFPREFYVAYENAWPLDPGYETRRDLYNLYHVLNHLNLFGGTYLRQAVMLMDRVLSDIS